MGTHDLIQLSGAGRAREVDQLRRLRDTSSTRVMARTFEYDSSPRRNASVVSGKSARRAATRACSRGARRQRAREREPARAARRARIGPRLAAIELRDELEPLAQRGVDVRGEGADAVAERVVRVDHHGTNTCSHEDRTELSPARRAWSDPRARCTSALLAPRETLRTRPICECERSSSSCMTSARRCPSGEVLEVGDDRRDRLGARRSRPGCRWDRGRRGPRRRSPRSAGAGAARRASGCG